MDASPASLFNSYEQDFQQILQSIRDKLEGDGTDQRGGRLWTPACHPDLSSLVLLPEQKKATLRRVEMELDEADEMVSIWCFPHTRLPVTSTAGFANGDRDSGDTPVYQTTIPVSHTVLQSGSRTL